MRAVVFSILLCCLGGCGDIYRYAISGEVGWALKKELRDKHSSEVALANFTNFEWDELFIFNPYEPTSDVCRRLTLTPDDCASTIKSESTDDSEMLMVFRQMGRTVHSEIHIRRHGDFTPIPDEILTPASAVFTVLIEGKNVLGEDWLKLRKKPSTQGLTGSQSGR